MEDGAGRSGREVARLDKRPSRIWRFNLITMFCCLDDFWEKLVSFEGLVTITKVWLAQTISFSTPRTHPIHTWMVGRRMQIVVS